MSKTPNSSSSISTLHSALDAYAEFTECQSRPAVYRTTKSRIDILKRQHSDLPLHNLTASVLTEILQFWANRPASLTGKRYQATTVRTIIGELRRFFRWVDLSDACEWVMPAGIDNFRPQIVKVPEDIGSLRRRNSTYTLHQLGLLFRKATNVEQSVLLLALNGAMTAAEIARLRVGDFIDGNNPKGSLPHECQPGESILLVRKPTKGRVRELLLWSETSDALRKLLQGNGKSECSHLFCSAFPNAHCQDRTPTQRIQQRWRRLVWKAQAVRPELPALPFRSLRKTAIKSLIEQTQLSDAGVVFGHYHPTLWQDLTPPRSLRYRSIRDLRSHFQPVFDLESRSD